VLPLHIQIGPVQIEPVTPRLLRVRGVGDHPAVVDAIRRPPKIAPALRSAIPILIAACVIAIAPQAALAQSSLPDPALTPGAINPAVTQSDIQSTLCVRGWTRTVRLPWQYTDRLKAEQIREYG
jgi:hypothetical protein